MEVAGGLEKMVNVWSMVSTMKMNTQRTRILRLSSMINIFVVLHIPYCNVLYMSQ